MIFDSDFFDKRYHSLKSKNKTASRMKWDPSTGTFLTSFYDPMINGFSTQAEVQNVDQYDNYLVRAAIETPNLWVGCSVGDPGDDDPPEHLRTNIKTLYRQHNQHYCLSYSLASALFYCGFKEAASILATQARIFSSMHLDESLKQLRELMLNLVPVIGKPLLFPK